MRLSKPLYTLLACWLVFAASSFLRTVFLTLVPIIAGELRFSTAQAGYLITIFSLGYAMAVWVSGNFSGHPKAYVIGGSLVSIIMVLVLLNINNYYALIIAAPVCAAGVGLYLPRGLAILAGTPQDKRGMYLSIHQTATFFAMIAGSVYIGIVIDNWGWKSILCSCCVLLIIGIIFFSSIETEDGTVSTERTRKNILRNSGNKRVFLYFVIITSCLFVLMTGLFAVLPLMMMRGWNMPPSFTATYIGMVRLGGLLGPFVLGYLTIHKGYFKILYWCSIISLACTVTMIFLPFGVFFTILLVVIISLASGSVPILFATVPVVMDCVNKEKVLGTMSGMASIFGSSLMPGLLGYIIEHYSPSDIFIPISLSTFIAIIILQRLMGIDSRLHRECDETA